MNSFVGGRSRPFFVTISNEATATAPMQTHTVADCHSGRLVNDSEAAKYKFNPAAANVTVNAKRFEAERTGGHVCSRCFTGIIETFMKVLIASWRCPEHPRAGGAEHLTLRIAAGLVRRGHDVTWFAAGCAGLPGEVVIDGVQIIRRARQGTVHAYFGIWLKLRDTQQNQFDVIVDQVNTIPFFAHWYTVVPTVAFFHQLAREVWFYETGWFMAHVGYALEPVYLSPYRQVPLVTDSPSSLVSLREIGLLGNATIIPLAVDPPGLPVPEVGLIPATLRLVITCRLVQSKRVDHAVRTVALLYRRGLPVSVDIIGAGSPEMVSALRKLVSVLGISHIVTFHGRISTFERDGVVSSAFLIMGTSVREGWGLSITEANILGVPGAVYPVPGLCDSTIHDQTGVISLDATPPSLADAIERLWRDGDLYRACRAGARAFASGLSWDRTVMAFEQALLRVVR